MTSNAETESGLISIGLPVVKPNFLEKSLIGCLNQTYKNFEIVVLNNAASNKLKDEIKQTVGSFQDDRIRYIENENQIPMVENWNKVLNFTSGEFFTLLCDDDKWHPDFLIEMISLARKYPDTNIFHSRVAFIDIDDNAFRLSQLCPDYEDGLDFVYHRISGFRSMFLSDFFVKRDVLCSIGGFVDLPDGWGSDDLTWYKLAINNGVAYTQKVLMYYRVSQQNVSNRLKVKSKLISIEKQHSAINDIVSSYKSSTLIEEVKIEMIQDKLEKFIKLKKMFLRKKELQENYHIPYPIALGIAYLKGLF